MTETTEYLELVRLIEQAGRRLHSAIEAALCREGFYQLTAEQAIILYSIGEQAVTFTDIAKRGYYLGTNAAYNKRKLLEMGLLDQTRPPGDRRRTCLSLTDAGRAIRAVLSALFETHAMAMMRMSGVRTAEANVILARLDSFWRGLVV